MRVLRDTPFELGCVAWRPEPGHAAATFVAKATFAVVPGGVCAIAEKQEPIHGEVHFDDEETASVRLDSDMALLKPRAECLLAATCHAPGGRPATAVFARFAVGGVEKILYVVGDRRWGPLGATDPVPFTSMRIAYERAFGGPGYAKNPLGRGIVEEDGPAGVRAVYLPNLESPRAPIASPLDRPDPWCPSPIPRTWKARTARLGNYDARWRETRWPWFPEDFDARYFNAAPEDQQVDRFWTGDEAIALENLHAEHAVIEAKLPGLRARCFVEIARPGEAAPRIEEVPLRLDTIAIDADRLTVTCLFRGLLRVPDEKLTAIGHAYLTHESIRDARPAEEHVRAFAAKIAARAADVRAFPAEAPLPVRAAEAAEIVATALAPMTDFEMQRLRALALGISEPIPPRAAPPAPVPAGQAGPPPGSTAVDPRRDVVLGRIARGEPLDGVDLVGVDLRGADLRGVDLARRVLKNARFGGARLDDAKLDRAVLAGADLESASLAGASLREADLTGASAPSASFDRADLGRATFERATLARATFRDAAAERADFAAAVLTGAVFDGADLAHADLSRAAIGGASFVGARMASASIEGAKGEGARFDRADATKLRASEGADLTDAVFVSATASGALFGTAVLRGANFSYANLERADFGAADLEGTNLNACVLTSASFRGAKLRGARVMQSKAFEATFEGADLTNADLRGACLYGAELLDANVTAARLDHANLTRTKLER